MACSRRRHDAVWVRCNCLLYAGERLVITNPPGSAIECSSLEFRDHEYVLWHIVLAPERVPRRWLETEARVVFGVTDDNYGTRPEIFAAR